MIAGKKPDQQWNAEDAGQRNGVGQVHRGLGPPTGKKGKLAAANYPPAGTVKAMKLTLSEPHDSAPFGKPRHARVPGVSPRFPARQLKHDLPLHPTNPPSLPALPTPFI